MLQQDTSAADPGLTAAQTRVNPQELADALKALQAHQEEAARHLDDTLPIGEALRELNLDATPEEVLAEVQAQRAGTGKRGRRSRVKAARLTLGAVLLALTGVGLHSLIPHHQASGRWSGPYLGGEEPLPVNFILNGDGTGNMVAADGMTSDNLRWAESGHTLHVSIDTPAGTSSSTGILSDDDKQLNLSLPSNLVDPGWQGGTVFVVLSKN